MVGLTGKTTKHAQNYAKSRAVQLVDMFVSRNRQFAVRSLVRAFCRVTAGVGIRRK